MDPELQKIIRETYKLAEENNRLLRKVRGVQKREAFLALLKWSIILAIGVGSFYFLQPYIDLVKQTIDSTGDTINKFNNLLPR